MLPFAFGGELVVCLAHELCLFSRLFGELFIVNNSAHTCGWLPHFSWALLCDCCAYLPTAHLRFCSFTYTKSDQNISSITLLSHYE